MRDVRPRVLFLLEPRTVAPVAREFGAWDADSRRAADELADDGGTCSMSFLMPVELRERIEQAARTTERSAGAIVRFALKAYLEGEERDESEWR